MLPTEDIVHQFKAQNWAHEDNNDLMQAILNLGRASQGIDGVTQDDNLDDVKRMLHTIMHNSNNNDVETSYQKDASINNDLDADQTSSNNIPEMIDHLPILSGHQYVQGGSGEGRQLLGPNGSFENVQVIKTDTALPSYCDPPNPCPIGFTSE